MGRAPSVGPGRAQSSAALVRRRADHGLGPAFPRTASRRVNAPHRHLRVPHALHAAGARARLRRHPGGDRAGPGWHLGAAAGLPAARSPAQAAENPVKTSTPSTPAGGSSLIFTSDADRTEQVLQAVRLHGRHLPCPSETRCSRDGRRLGAVFRLPDGLWAWSAGNREPPEVARRKAAAFYLDALDECNSDRERQACFAAASQALEADVRPIAHPAVTPVRVLSAAPVRYQTGFGITVVAGPEFLVTEVSCGCRTAVLPRPALADRPGRRAAPTGRARPGARPASAGRSARACAAADARVAAQCSA